MTLNNYIKRIICFMLAIIIAFCTVGCGKDTPTETKKKKVIKKKIVQVIVDDEDTENTDDNLDNTDSSEESEIVDETVLDETVPDETVPDETVPEYIRRALYEKEEEKEYVETYEPQYELKTSNFEITEDYVIVYSNDVMYAKTHALSLQTYFKNNGLELAVEEESNVSASSNLVLVGNTKFYKSSLKENEFEVLLSKNNLIFSGSHFLMVENAVDWFVSLNFEKGKVNLVSGKIKDFVSSVTTTRGKYDYVWGDEFSGVVLDDNKWIQDTNRLHVYPSTLKSQTLKDVFDVSDGLLKMSAIKYYDDEYPSYKYASGRGVFTEDRMSYLFGYAELRVRNPFSRGVWPNWWLDGRDPFGQPNLDDYFCEINLMEQFSTKDTVTPNIHKWYWGKGHSQYNQNGRKATQWIFKDTTNLKNEYHVYGFEWTPEEIIISVDGNEYMTFDFDYNFDNNSTMDSFKNNPLEMAISFGLCTADNTNLGSDLWILNDEDLPFHMYVDYIRIYQNKSIDGNRLYVRDENGNAVAMH